MTRLMEFTSYAKAQRHCSKEGLWELFDGTPERFNIAYECIDRHVTEEAVALQIAHAEGTDEILSFAEIARRSSQIAHYLIGRGIQKGDRVAAMIEPSLPFYCALFAVIKTGAVAVPMFSLFGPDGIRLRVGNCKPEIFFANSEKAADAIEGGARNVIVVDQKFLDGLSDHPEHFDCDTTGRDLAGLQYTSGTTRLLPAAVATAINPSSR